MRRLSISLATLTGLGMMAVACLHAAPVSAQAQCNLGGVGSGAGGERRFTVQPNQVCVIQRRPPNGMVYIDLKILVRPKLGSFGKAGLDAMAYRAGSRPGEDYFEYDSILSAGGQIQHSVIRNYVTIAP